MAHSKTWMAAAFAVAANLLPAQTTPANGQKPADAVARAAQGVAIGVVDLDKAIELYPKAIAERERLQAMSKSFSAEIDGMSKQIEALRGDLALHKEGTSQREAKEFELGMALKQREGFANLRKGQFDRELEKFELMIYQDLEVAVAEVAKMRGVQIVLRVRAAPSPEDAGKDVGNAQKQKLATFDRRQVWFASDEVDLTPALIKYLQVPVDPKKVDAGKPPQDPAKQAPKQDAAAGGAGSPKGGGL